MPGINKIRGRLEKKKEWIQRTRDYREKADKIKHLKRKAKERNPDEFNFHMLRSQVGLDGTHRDLDSDEEQEEQTEVQRLLDDIEDIGYVRYHLGKERKKIEKLQNVLHFHPADMPKNKHIIYVDNEEEASGFDAAKHFNTPEQFLGRTFNRPKLDQISDFAVGKAEMEKLKMTEKECGKLYDELGKRIERERELAIVLQKLELKKELALSKKSLRPKLIQKGDSRRAAVYKWKYERKK